MTPVGAVGAVACGVKVTGTAEGDMPVVSAAYIVAVYVVPFTNPLTTHEVVVTTQLALLGFATTKYRVAPETGDHVNAALESPATTWKFVGTANATCGRR
jgi:hypothetical protein